MANKTAAPQTAPQGPARTSRKAAARMTVDAGMTALLLCLMAWQVTGPLWHEWLGAGCFVLFIAHHLLNLGWYRGLLRGRYTPYRAAVAVSDLLVLADMLGLMVSSVLLSRYVFAFLPLGGGLSFARLAHLLCSSWAPVLMGLHLGLHWGTIKARLKKARPGPQKRAAALPGRLLAFAAAGWGVYAFFALRLPEYLFLHTQFAAFDYAEPATLVFARYLGVLCLFCLIGFYVADLLRRAGHPTPEKAD